jgi:hypothetical protein
MQMLTRVVVAIAVVLTIMFAGPYAWDYWSWRRQPAPKTPEVHMTEGEKKDAERTNLCILAELAKGAKEKMGMIAVMAAIHNRRSEKGADNICNDFRGYILLRAPSQGKATNWFANREEGFVVNFQGEYGKKGMPQRVGIAQTVLAEYLKKRGGMFDLKSHPHLASVARFDPPREDYWVKVAGTDPAAMRRDGLHVCYTSPSGTVFYCR